MYKASRLHPKTGRHRSSILATLLMLQLAMPALAEQCNLRQIAHLPISMNGLRPTMTAQINGSDALFMLDSGAFWSMLSPAAAEQYGLQKGQYSIPGFSIMGVGGRVNPKIATVATFSVFSVPLHKVEFVVGGSDVRNGIAGVLGQNFLRSFDVEYDLARGNLNIFSPKGCGRSLLAYWVKAGEPYSQLELEPTTPWAPHTIATVYLNGVKLRATFDTGASTSVLGLHAAARVGIRPDSPGVKEEGEGSGLGRQAIKVWSATFPNLKVGDEEVHNAHLEFGDLGEIDMLIGADFFLSHHIYVSNSQRRLYFTYNGGPVFNLTSPAKIASADTGAPEDADTLARRAAASAARHDYEGALRDFDKACALAPENAAYFYQRGMVRFALQQPEGGEDIDRALELRPDYVDALVARARKRLAEHQTAEAVADLDKADRVAPKESDVRWELAQLYNEAGRFAAVIEQLDLWMPRHSQDVRLADGLNERCWVRAVSGKELDQALADCNAALRINGRAAKFLDSRALVHLRRKEFDKSIADYNAALKINPKSAWLLYCRGVAKLGSRSTHEGEADIAAAKALDPRITERIKQYEVGS